ncbi:hypothetical protein ILYODFUR_022258 [Ilyodon furcidens]|uniref:Uncharacterized protein n=1 Tax=Ilyodon furcidens TaxID=33524 RepID=A0ABV0V822_9TELE
MLPVSPSLLHTFPHVYNKDSTTLSFTTNQKVAESGQMWTACHGAATHSVLTLFSCCAHIPWLSCVLTKLYMSPALSHNAPATYAVDQTLAINHRLPRHSETTSGWCNHLNDHTTLAQGNHLHVNLEISWK